MHPEKQKKLSAYEQPESLRMFNERLKTFPSQVGKRNPQLLGLVNYGIRAGMTDDQIETEIIERSGEPPLTCAEIRHALDTAHKTAGLFRQNAVKKDSAPPLGSRAKDYVPNMITMGAGTTLDKLAAISPVPIPEDAAEQTKLFLATLYAGTEYVFIGDTYGRGVLSSTIKKVSEWNAQPTPRGPYLIINPLTGEQGTTQSGEPSYRCSACVSSLRYILVEADDATLEAQWAFWAGVISSQTLPLRSLVYSGNDSVHGIVEIAANSPDKWRTMQKKVMFAVAHPSARKEQKADEACNNFDRLTRLAGATNLVTKRLQRLLWLSPKPLGI